MTFEPRVALHVDGEQIFGSSKSSLARQAVQPDREVRFELREIAVNAALAPYFRVNTDEEGFEFRLFDGFGTPLFEWRLETTAYD